MSKKWPKNEESRKMARFCMTCRRIYGCKDGKNGKDCKDCTTCEDIAYCVAGVLIERTPEFIQKTATCGLCNTCFQSARTHQKSSLASAA